MFFDKLKQDGLLDNTVIVLYGDHEGLHKYFPQDVLNFKPSQAWWLDNKKQLPLFIYETGLQGKVIDTKGGQIDILPTISYLMGVDQKNYESTAMGRNLLKTAKNFAVLRTKQVIIDKPDPKQELVAQKGLTKADMIIRSDYFKNN